MIDKQTLDNSYLPRLGAYCVLLAVACGSRSPLDDLESLDLAPRQGSGGGSTSDHGPSQSTAGGGGSGGTALPDDDASALDASSNGIDAGTTAQNDGSPLDTPSQPDGSPLDAPSQPDGSPLDGGQRCEPVASCAPCRLRYIATAFASTCGIKLDSTVVCWGSDQWKVNEVPPGQFAQISSGDFHTCGIRPDGTVTCWGSNSYGQLDAPGGQFIQVSGGWTHTCGIRSDHSIACWGNNDAGEASPPAGQFREVAAGLSITCAIRSADSSVVCWGAGLSAHPSGPFVHIRAGQTACALTSDGTAFCWPGTPAEPIVRHDGPFLDISVAAGYACGIKSDGSIVCWGNSFAGQTSPPSGAFTRLSVGDMHGCALRADGTVACWGDDESGERDVPYCQENAVDGGPHEPTGDGAPTEDAASDALSEDRIEAPSGVIDQSNRIEYGNVGLQPDQYPGQSFTVGHPGTLVGIGVPMYRYDSQVGPTELVTLRLFRCSTQEVCDSVPLATATVALDTVSTTYPSPVIPESGESGYFDLSAAALRVEVGDVYFFLLSPPPARDLLVLSSGANDPYRGGIEFLESPYRTTPFPSKDLVFGTYVAP